ncbi:Gp138 family membrane-puncturing spike protein [Pseudomonas sp. NPDC089428]|uniref:Gp138 family membrane-puncturing spike protein n=1 Tax=Pseudomonas sp. NPDC089428 TaxID=3364467 RepID=UPI0038242309
MQELGGWEDYISGELHNHNEATRTAFPAKVIGTTGRFTATIEVSVWRKDDEGESMDDTYIINVPIAPHRTANSLIYMPVKVGDTGYCVVMDNNIDNYKIMNNTQSINTANNRMKDAMDSVFVPGLAPFAVLNEQMNNLVLGNDANDLLIVHNAGSAQEAQLVLKADGNVEVHSQFTVKVIGKDIELSATDSITISAQQMNVNVAQTNWTGQGYVTGEWTVNGIPMSTHVHTGVTPGTGSTGIPTA